MISPHPLDRLIERETFAEIVAMLAPEDLVVAVLRLEGLSDTQIGEMLGCSSSAVRQRMVQAQMRIVQQRPDLATVLGERRHPHAYDDEALPLERGWLGHLDEQEEDLPTVDGAGVHDDGLGPDDATQRDHTADRPSRWATSPSSASR